MEAEGGEMIIGEYPCCDGDLWIYLPDIQLPVFEKEICPHCGKAVWHYLSRVEPISYTEEQFNEKYEVDEETKNIKERK